MEDHSRLERSEPTFQTEWTPLSEDQGDYEFAAFPSKRRCPVPVLEIAENSLKQLHVRGPGWHGNVTFTLQGNETTDRESGGGNIRIVSTYTDSASGTYELESIPGAESTGVLRVAQASGTMSKGLVEQTTNHYTFGGCNITMSQTRENFEKGVLERLEGAPAVITFAGDGTYEILIPNMTGTSAGTGRTAVFGDVHGAQL